MEYSVKSIIPKQKKNLEKHFEHFQKHRLKTKTATEKLSTN